MNEAGRVIPCQVLTPPEATFLTGLSRHQLLYPLSAQDPKVGELIRRIDLGIARVLIAREGAEAYSWLMGRLEQADMPPVWRPGVTSFSYDEAGALLGVSVSSIHEAIRRGRLKTLAGQWGSTMVRRDSITSVLGVDAIRDWPAVEMTKVRAWANGPAKAEEVGEPGPASMIEGFGSEDQPGADLWKDATGIHGAAGHEQLIDLTVLASELDRVLKERFSDLFGQIALVRSGLAELLEMAKGLPDDVEREIVAQPTSTCKECGTMVIYAREHRLGYSELLVEDSNQGNIVMLTNGRFYKFVHTNQFNQARAEGIPRYRKHDCQSGRSRRRDNRVYSIRS